MPKDKIFDIAKKIAKDNNPTVFYLIKILFSDQNFSIYCLIYTYFRWLDDQIDSSFISKNNSLLLLNRQKEIFIILYTDCSYDKVIVQNIYERMLIKVIAYDVLNNCKLKNYIKQFLDALEFDVNRRYKLCSQIDLDRYSFILGGAYASIIKSLANDKNDFNLDHIEMCFAGFAAHQVHIMRDFYIDMSLGYYNISEQDFFNLELSFDKLSRRDIRPWVLKTSMKARATFNEGLRAIRSLDSFKLKFLFTLISIRYLVTLNAIIDNNYYIQDDNQNFSKNILIRYFKAAPLLRHTIFDS